jgi:hypothetical protein
VAGGLEGGKESFENFLCSLLCSVTLLALTPILHSHPQWTGNGAKEIPWGKCFPDVHLHRFGLPDFTARTLVSSWARREDDF